MKFIFADALDQIDPKFDFLADRSAAARKPYWDDEYPHEVFARPPYDGVLVSRGIVGDGRRKGKYSDAQSLRFRREGARNFLRLSRGTLRNMPIFGDCGAFTYKDDPAPPYRSDDTVEFYLDGQFTHGCSVDHIIFTFAEKAKALQGAQGDDRVRFDITQENARTFFKLARKMPNFTPLGVIQGWSANSMALAARNLEKMGYRYLAVGGMVPLDAPQIHSALAAIRACLKPTTGLHLLGFAKAEQIHEFTRYGVESFDSTSPLIRAFKDATANYYAPSAQVGLEYFTAIRVPQALENPRLVRAAKEGRFRQDDLLRAEKESLHALRRFDNGLISAAKAAAAVLAYKRCFLAVETSSPSRLAAQLAKAQQQLMRTLEAAPWRQCGCPICKAARIEVMIFRASNRNKRRGFHNLRIYHHYVKGVLRAAA